MNKIANNIKIEELHFDTSYTNPNNLLTIAHVLKFPRNLLVLSVRYAKKFDDECLRVIPSSVTDIDLAATAITDRGT